MIYLDNAATTPCFPEVTRAVVACMEEAYGNPSSPHAKGLEAERIVKDARRTIASILDVGATEIVFTSGATESNNLALKGAARSKIRHGRHVVVSRIEHSSVINAAKDLENEGFSVTWVDPEPDGRISVDAILGAIRSDTVLVSVMAVNNETGVIQPIEEIALGAKADKPDLVMHVDGVQAFCKLPLYPARIGIDLFSLTGHKLHGPKGIGALYVRKGMRLSPMMGGGDHEGGIRSGTENVPGIAGLAVAAKRCSTSLDEAKRRWRRWRDLLLDRVRHVPGFHHNGAAGDAAAPHILNVSFAGIPGEVLVHALSAAGVCVSTGSACRSKGGEPKGGSHVLRAMQVPEERLKSALRISFSYLTKESEVERAAELIATTVTDLQRVLEGSK